MNIPNLNQPNLGSRTDAPPCTCLKLTQPISNAFFRRPQYQKIVDAEWDILYDKLERIHKSGAKVVLSKLPIGDVATQVKKSVLN